jgi:hypothetical protein
MYFNSVMKYLAHHKMLKQKNTTHCQDPNLTISVHRHLFDWAVTVAVSWNWIKPFWTLTDLIHYETWCGKHILSSFWISELCHEDLWGGGKPPQILDLGLDWDKLCTPAGIRQEGLPHIIRVGYWVRLKSVWTRWKKETAAPLTVEEINNSGHVGNHVLRPVITLSLLIGLMKKGEENSLREIY